MKARLLHWQGKLEQALQPALAWYASRVPREQRVLQLLGATIALLLVLSLVWMPAWNARERSMSRWQAQQQLLLWITTNEPVLQQRQQAGQKTTTLAGDWMSGLSRSAAASAVSVKSINQEGDQAARVQLENQSFAATFLWLQSLSAQGVQVASMEMLPGAESGRVNLRATLRRAF